MSVQKWKLFISVIAVVVSPCAAPAQTSAAELLISPAELSRELRSPDLVLLYVGPKPDYDAGHVPGARFVSMGDLAAPRVEGAPTLELPTEADLRARLERLGISNNSRVVVIPGEDWGSPSTRIVWTLDVAGLGARTRLLNGGTVAWKKAGLPLTSDVPPVAANGRLTLTQNRSLVVDHTWMQARLGDTSFRLIDARAPMFYSGAGMSDANGEGHGAGHIPGARNLPFNTITSDDVAFPSLDELRKKFAEAGVTGQDTVVAYCHVGQQATMVLFAARLLGHPVKLYDGSFNDWEARKLPIENPKAGASPLDQ